MFQKKSLLSKQAIFYLYQQFVTESLHQGLPVQNSLNQSQIDLVFSIMQQANNTVFGLKLYPTFYHKIAFILFEIIKKHIFVDGNKRFALLLTVYLLENLTFEKWTISREDLEMLVMRVASDTHYTLDDARAFLKLKLKILKKRSFYG